MKNCLCKVYIHNPETACIFSQLLHVNFTNNVNNNIQFNILFDTRKLLL